MADKTSSGRSKNTSCPHCDQMFYSIHTLNVHIAYKHPGERTIKAGTAPKRLKTYKKQKKTKPVEKKLEPKEEDQEVIDYGDEEEDDPY